MLENRKILKLFWLFSNVIVRSARGPKFRNVDVDQFVSWLGKHERDNAIYL